MSFSFGGFVSPTPPTARTADLLLSQPTNPFTLQKPDQLGFFFAPTLTNETNGDARRNYTIQFRQQFERTSVSQMAQLQTSEERELSRSGRLFDLIRPLFKGDPSTDESMKLQLDDRVDPSKQGVEDDVKNTFLGLILECLNQYPWFSKKLVPSFGGSITNPFGGGLFHSNPSPAVGIQLLPSFTEVAALGQIVLGLKHNVSKYGFHPTTSTTSPTLSSSSDNRPAVSAATIGDIIPSAISTPQPSPVPVIATVPQSTRLSLDHPLLVGTYRNRKDFFPSPNWPSQFDILCALPLDDGLHQFLYGMVDQSYNGVSSSRFRGWCNTQTGQCHFISHWSGRTYVGEVNRNSFTHQWGFIGEWKGWNCGSGKFELLLDETTLHPSAPLTPDIQRELDEVKSQLNLSTSINSTNQPPTNQTQIDLMKPKPNDLITHNRLLTHPFILCILEFGRPPLSTLIQPMMELFQILLQSATATTAIVDGENQSLKSESAISLTPTTPPTNISISVKSNVGIMNELEFAFLRLFQLNPGMTKEVLPFIRLFRQTGIKPKEVIKKFNLLSNDSSMATSEKDDRPINMWVYFSQWLTLEKIEFLLRWLLEEPNLCDLYDPNYRLDWGDGRGEQTILAYITHLKDQHPHLTALQIYHQILVYLSQVVSVDSITHPHVTDNSLDPSSNSFDSDEAVVTNLELLCASFLQSTRVTFAAAVSSPPSPSSSSSSSVGDSGVCSVPCPSSFVLSQRPVLDESTFREWLKDGLHQMTSSRACLSARLLERFTQARPNINRGDNLVKSSAVQLTPLQSSLHEAVSELLLALRQYPSELNLLEEDAYGNILLHSILSLPTYELIRLKAVEKQFFQKLDHLPPTIMSTYSDILLFNDSLNPTVQLSQETRGGQVGTRIFPSFHPDTLRLEVTGMQWYQLMNAPPTFQLWNVKTEQVLAEIEPNPATITPNAFNKALFSSPIILTPEQHSMGVIGAIRFPHSRYPFTRTRGLLNSHPDVRLDDVFAYYQYTRSSLRAFGQIIMTDKIYLVAPIIRKVVSTPSSAAPHTQPTTGGEFHPLPFGGLGLQSGGFGSQRVDQFQELGGPRQTQFSGFGGFVHPPTTRNGWGASATTTFGQSATTDAFGHPPSSSFGFGVGSGFVAPQLQPQPIVQAPGTRHRAFQPLVESSCAKDADGYSITTRKVYQSITSLPEYEYKTFEELRCEDDALGGIRTYLSSTPFGASSSSSSTTGLPNVDKSHDQLTFASKSTQVVYAPITPSLLYGRAMPTIQIGPEGQMMTVPGNGSKAPLDILFPRHSPYPIGEFIYELFDRLLSKALLLIDTHNPPTVNSLVTSNSVGNFSSFYSNLITPTTDVVQLHAWLNLFQSHSIYPPETTLPLPDVFTTWIQSRNLGRIQQWFTENHSTDALWPQRLSGDLIQRSESLLDTAKRILCFGELFSYLQSQSDEWYDIYVPLIRINITDHLISDLAEIVLNYLIPARPTLT